MYEVEKLIGRVEWIRRYKAGPFAEERAAFLVHLEALGYTVLQLKTNNKYLLGIAELIDVHQCDSVGPAQIKQAAKQWTLTHCRVGSAAGTVRIARGAFSHIATDWLRFLGKWNSNLPVPVINLRWTAFCGTYGRTEATQFIRS